ncbi:MAG TPA: spermidine synthase [Thermoleophilia bacterium]|nr:spermidine synthase [Thermoleophilia bacterium]
MLFLELMLIRWAAANVLYLAYFTNFVLLASFLGIGVGFLRARSRREGFGRAPIVLALLLGFIVLFPVQVDRDYRVVGLLGTPALPLWISLPVVFLLVTAVMALVAEGVARTFATFAPLAAYRLDILGSLLGIATFSALAFLHTPPIVWGGVVVAAFLALLPRPLRKRQLAALAGVLVLLAPASFAPHTFWSPYYKVSVSGSGEGVRAITVNGLPHQSIYSLSLLRRDDAFYLYPYRHLKGHTLADVLVVGAGNGNDVALALSQGARHIDAVEIDPVIRSIGARDHPDHPYQDPRVSVHIDDGRAFLERSQRRYDLIIFALPDSLTLVSGQSSLRLESYLFTLQAMRSVRAHLRPGGVFTMYNYYRPDVFDRYAATIALAFGHPPCIDRGPDRGGPRRQAVLTVGRAADDVTCSTPWVAPRRAPLIATDDHPFPYMTSRSIPPFYLVTLLLILFVSLVLVRRSGGPLRQMRPYLDLFFMGAAFLLLETKNVVQFALLFGTTWFVNALVFGGILLAVFLAVEVARHARLPSAKLLYLILAAALVVAGLVSPETLLAVPFWPRLGAAVGIAFAPVFLANLVFAQRFRDVGSSTVAFGANLLGAMVGGVLEYLALVTGYRALLLVVVVLYALAFATRPAPAGAAVGESFPGGASEPL